jgi:hypothetical protein
VKLQSKLGKLTPVLRGGISVTLAIVMIVALFMLWLHGEQMHKSQLQLMQMEVAVDSANALEWQTISDLHVTAQEQQGLASSFEKIKSTFSELDPKVRTLPELQHIHALSLAYIAAVTKEVSLIAEGRVDEAHVLDETLVDPTLEKLRAELAGQNQTQGARARTASLIQILGSIAVVLFSCSLILMLSQKAQDFRTSQSSALARNDPTLLTKPDPAARLRRG